MTTTGNNLAHTTDLRTTPPRHAPPAAPAPLFEGRVASSSLDPPETTSPRDLSSLPQQPLYVPTYDDRDAWPDLVLNTEHPRHKHWTANRQRVYDAMNTLARYVEEPNGKPLVSRHRLRRFADCGCDCWLQQHATDQGRWRVVRSTCRDRFCTPCQRDRARIIRANLDRHLTEQPYRFITLTLRHESTPLRDQLDRLLKCWSALRRRKFIANRLKGGAAFVEITVNQETGDWHPHLHVVAEGSYIPQADLRKAWLEITGDSHIVDIRLIRSKGQACRYVTKYVTKAFSNELYENEQDLHEAIRAMRGRKLCHAFGTWHHLRLTATDDVDQWVTIGRLADWAIFQDDLGDDAHRIFHALPDPMLEWSAVDLKLGP